MSVCQSVRQSQKPLSLSELLLSTIEPIDHQAYQPSSPLTIEPIDLWSSFTTFKPFDLLGWTYAERWAYIKWTENKDEEGSKIFGE